MTPWDVRYRLWTKQLPWPKFDRSEGVPEDGVDLHDIVVGAAVQFDPLGPAVPDRNALDQDAVATINGHHWSSLHHAPPSGDHTVGRPEGMETPMQARWDQQSHCVCQVSPNAAANLARNPRCAGGSGGNPAIRIDASRPSSRTPSGTNNTGMEEE